MTGCLLRDIGSLKTIRTPIHADDTMIVRGLSRLREVIVIKQLRQEDIKMIEEMVTVDSTIVEGVTTTVMSQLPSTTTIGQAEILESTTAVVLVADMEAQCLLSLAEISSFWAWIPS